MDGDNEYLVEKNAQVVVSTVNETGAADSYFVIDLSSPEKGSGVCKNLDRATTENEKVTAIKSDSSKEKATENGPIQKPFHLSSNYPYQ